MSAPPNGHPRELLSEYLDDELGIEQRASIDRHLADCEDCRDHLLGLRRLARAVAEEGVPSVPVDLAARIGRRLDAATIVTRRRSRFVVPATIAATLGAIGILVALQWREGRLVAPVPPEPMPDRPIQTEKDEPKQAVPEDIAIAGKDKEHEEAVEGGVVSGVVGGAAGGSAAYDGRSDRDASKRANEAAELAPSAPAAAPAQATAARVAKAEVASPCIDRWSDSGLRGNWDVEDVDTAERELGRVAHAVSGIGLWRGVADGRPYVVVVPRASFEEVFYALRARGVTGFPETPPLAEGTDCAGIAITIAVVPHDPAPPPR